MISPTSRFIEIYNSRICLFVIKLVYLQQIKDSISMLTKQEELYLRKILTEAIKDALTDNSVSIKKFIMNDPNDNSYVINNSNIIWNILQDAYQEIGGFKGK